VGQGCGRDRPSAAWVSSHGGRTPSSRMMRAGPASEAGQRSAASRCRAYRAVFTACLARPYHCPGDQLRHRANHHTVRCLAASSAISSHLTFLTLVALYRYRRCFMRRLQRHGQGLSAAGKSRQYALLKPTSGVRELKPLWCCFQQYLVTNLLRFAHLATSYLPHATAPFEAWWEGP
jgi:hypothetical protein